MSDLEPLEPHVRSGEDLDPAADLVVRGWPLTVDGLMRNADTTRSRFVRSGAPFAAISAEVTVESWTLDRILAGPRLRTRSRYAAVGAGVLVTAGFELLATFASPHYSVVWSPTMLRGSGSFSVCSAKSEPIPTTSGGSDER